MEGNRDCIGGADDSGWDVFVALFGVVVLLLVGISDGQTDGLLVPIGSELELVGN